MNEKDYLLIEKYLEGTLSESDDLNFRERLKKDPLFLEAYQLRKSMYLFLKHKKGKEALKKELKSLGNKYLSEEKKSKLILFRPKWLKLSAAAAALLILAIAVNYFLPEKDLYERYAVIETFDQLQKGPETAIGRAEIAFNAGEYESAYKNFTEHLQNKPADIIALYYKGLSALQLNKHEEALTIFNDIASGKTIYKENAVWYKALTYLKTEDYSNSKKILITIPQSSPRYKKAQQLLADIEDK